MSTEAPKLVPVIVQFRVNAVVERIVYAESLEHAIADAKTLNWNEMPLQASLIDGTYEVMGAFIEDD